MATGVVFTNSMANHNYDSAMDKAIDAALTKAGIIIEGAAVGLAPRDTGRLIGSLTWRTSSAESSLSGGAGADDRVSKPGRKWLLHVGTNVHYAPHLEYGTRKMAKRPFLRPAFFNNKRKILKVFDKWVMEFLKRGK